MTSVEHIGDATLWLGDCVESMQAMPAASVQTCVTSPPYFGLRDYGCDGQIGLEPTPDEYVARLVAVFREVRSVLADDGCIWVNLGDSYASGTSNGGQYDFSSSGLKRDGRSEQSRVRTLTENAKELSRQQPSIRRDLGGIKPKDLIGIPWLVAFALRADGWYLRQDIIWAKPNPMPESVTDRCTKAHEYLFLLSKSARYYFDADAIKEPASLNTHPGYSSNGAKTQLNEAEFGVRPSKFDGYRPDTRNRRSVWTVATAPYAGAHFATFPPDLIEPCILSGCPKGGVVLDPFAGSGTTGAVALKNGRRAVLCELNEGYAGLIRERLGLMDNQPDLFIEPPRKAEQQVMAL